MDIGIRKFEFSENDVYTVYNNFIFSNIFLTNNGGKRTR